MATLSSRDRLQPALLDRLLDDAPRESSEAVSARVLSRQQLRQAVLRDLSWLFNAVRPEPEPNSVRVDDLARWQEVPLASRSVVNFGMPAFAGSTLSSMDASVIKRTVADVIRAFEPRIDPQGLVVDVKIDRHASHHNTMQISIRGRLWSQPVPLELMLSAEMDCETGHTTVRESRA